MNESSVEIEIRTKGDTSGAAAVQQAVEKTATTATTGAAQTAKAAEAATTASVETAKEAANQAAEQMSEAEERMASLMQEIREKREALQEQSRKAADEEQVFNEQAVSGLSRKALAVGALGAVMAAGVTVLTRWFQAQEHLTQALDNATAAGGSFIDEVLEQWIGKGAAVKQVLDDITRALGGQTDEMKALNEPLNQYADQMGAAEEAAKKFNDELDEQREALVGVKAALQANLDLLKEQLRTQETAVDIEARLEKEQIERGDGTPEDKAQRIAAVEKRVIQEKAAIRTRERTAEIEAANTEVKAMANELAKAEDARKKQDDRVNTARKVEGTGRVLDDLNEEFRRGRRDRNDPAEQKNYDESFKRHEAAKAAAQGVGTVADESSKLKSMDAAVEKQRSELERARQEATQRARILAEQQRRDELQTQDAMGVQDRKQSDAQEASQRRVDARVDAEGAAASPAADMQSEIQRAVSGMADVGSRMGANSPMRDMLGLLKQALTDGEGNTAAELAAVQQMLASMGEGRGQNAQAMQQALQQMQVLQASGSELSQRLASAFATMAQVNKALESRVAAIESEMQQGRWRQ